MFSFSFNYPLSRLLLSEKENTFIKHGETIATVNLVFHQIKDI